MSRIREFLFHSLPAIFMFLSASFIVLLVFVILEFELYIAFYIISLFGFLLAMILFADLVRYKRRRRALAELLGTVAPGTDIMKLLPEPYDALMRDSFSIIEDLDLEKRRLAEALDSERLNQLGYYTLWVHQIKTPISAMHMLLDSTDCDETPELRQELFKIESYADLALRYAKLTDIASDIVAERVDVAGVIRDSVKKYAVPFVYKKLTVTLELSDLVIFSDRRWLEFIVEQILDNAVKYTKRGGVTISLKDRAIAIRDTGIGIRESDLPLVFEKGYTGYNGRVDSRASGIGLYLAKKAADALSIRLEVTSKVGVGTEFTIVLPDAPDMYFG